VTYAALLDESRAVAGALAANGFSAGARVALLSDNRLEWLATAFGCFAAGGILTPFNTWSKPWDLEYLLEHSRPEVLVILDRLGRQDFLAYLHELVPEVWSNPRGEWTSARYPTLRSVIVIGDEAPIGAERYTAWIEGSGSKAAEVCCRPDDVAMVLYTSGSTARPKGVALAHRDLVVNGYEIGKRQGLTANDRIFLASPLCWAFGGANALMACITHGATLVMQRQFDSKSAIELLQSADCTAIYTLPVMTRALVNEPAFDRDKLTSLRRGLTMGSSADVRLAAEGLGVDLICNIYGSTETYGNCCVTPFSADLDRRAGSQGPPLPGFELRIVDPETGQSMDRNQVGEIHVRGRITPGYIDSTGRPEAVVDGEGFFHTGDLGRLDVNGWLEFSARDGDMIKSAGINISPLEVEEFMLSHPDVEQVVVCGGEDAVRGQQVVAFVQFAVGSQSDVNDLLIWCKLSISSYKVPAAIVAVDSFPLTATGKLARRELIANATAALSESSGGHDAGR